MFKFLFRPNFIRAAALSLLAVSLNLSCHAASPTKTPAAPSTTAAASNANKPDIGVNLEGLADWSRAIMFADAMKTSRAWGKTDRPWENENTVKTDEHGWPLEDAGVVVLVEVPEIGGTYHLSFAGKADVEGRVSNLKIENMKYDAAQNTSTADVVVDDNSTQIMLAFLHTDGGVKNVKLMRPGYAAGETFTKPFLEKLAPFSTIRFMDFLSTNNNPVKTWSERTTPEYSSQTRAQGAALEYAVELANVSGKDLWVNVPDQADDDYARRMAQLLKNGLKKNQIVYVEWSNEVWNWQFQQATRNLNAAKTEGKEANSPLAFDKDNNEGYWAMRRIAKRDAEVGQIFRDVFNDQNFARVRPVFATQVAYEEVYKQGLAFLESQYKQPDKAIYGVAGAPYFQISDELNKKKNLTVDEIFDAIPDSMKQNMDWATTLGSYAKYYGLHHLAYEGGQHLQDHINAGNAEVKVQANRDPRIADALEKYLNNWNALGGELFMYFSLSSSFSKWGSWGLVDDITKTSPKYEAVLKVLNAPRAALNVGVAVGEEIKAGDFSGTNRWDKKGAEQVTIEPDKWMQYSLRAPRAGTYKLTAQVASDQDASAQVLVNSQPQGALEIKNGQGTASVAIKLQAGLNVIRVLGRDGRFNLQSLRATDGP